MLYNFKSAVIRISRKKDYTVQLIRDKSAMKDGQVYQAMPFILEKQLSNSLHSDKVILLDHGEVCEIGTHTELMQLKGKYYNMYLLQAQKYEHPKECNE